MKKIFTKYNFLLFIISFIVSSCDNDGTDSKGKVQDYNAGVTVFLSSRGNEDVTITRSSELETKFIEDESILYISQYGDNIMEDPFSDESSNLYKYKYSKKNPLYPDADWEQGYNFFPINSDNMIDWEVVRANGPHLNGFWFFALHYPYDNQMRFSVEKDQSTFESLQKSDVLGAYHSTSSLYTRLRFKLYHLMIYLKVTLYVPVFKIEEDINGDQNLSGFYADANKSVKLLNVHPNFKIEWNAKRGLDEAPLTQAITTGETCDIPLYLHPYDNGENNPPKKTIKINEFKPDAKEGEDEVYEYTFSCLFPAKQLSGFASNTFLRFEIAPYIGNANKIYTFSGEQFSGAGLRLEQGWQQNLELYLPRKGVKAILVSASVNDWINSESDMHLAQQEYNK